MSNLAETPLHAWHTAHGGRMVDFTGWSMPVQYTSIVEEHTATRTAAALFDVSHMGRFKFEGPGAAALLDRLLTRRVKGLAVGKIRYSLMCNEAGGILDDVLVYHLQKPEGDPFFGLVVNAGNREKIAGWIQQHLTDDVRFTDTTTNTAMIAVQGPLALQLAQELVETPLLEMGYYTGVMTNIGTVLGVVSRTGYTGEDGCELIVPAEVATDVWQSLMTKGESLGVKPAGLGARDTLRLEAAMPLYGHELSEDINPSQAGLGFAVNLKDRQPIGHEALAKFKQAEDQPQRVGLQMAGKRVPREHYSIMSGEQVVGEVTSGTFSPTLQCPIAMGYVHADFAAEGTELQIDIRGRREPARVVKLPFYTRTKE